MRYFVFIFMVGLAAAQPIPVPSPGIGGMNTVVDVNEMQPTQARYLLNTDVVSFPGMIKRRLGIHPFEIAPDQLWSAYGYYDKRAQRKMFWGATQMDTVALPCYDSATFDDVADTLYDFGGTAVFRADIDTVLARVKSTSFILWGNFTNLSELSTSLVEQPYWNPTVYHDWLYFDDNTIHASAGDIPVILTTSDVEWRANPDTITYRHRAVPIGIPRPGQLSARVLRYDAEDTLGDILADGSLEFWSSPDTLQFWDTLVYPAAGENAYANYSTPSDGDSALKIAYRHGTVDSIGISQTVVVKAGAQYRLTFDLHYVSRSSGYMVWEVISHPGDSLIAIDSIATTTGDYVEKTLNVTMLQFSTSATVRIMMRNETVVTQVAYIDNIVFRRGTATPVVNSLNADYVYAYQFGDASNRDGGDEFGDTSYHSAIVSPRNQAVMIYGFLPSPFALQDTTVDGGATGHQKATHAFLFRRNVAHPDIDVNWEQVTDFWFDGRHVPMIVDSGQNDGWWNSSGLGPRADTIPMPGQMIPNRTDSATSLSIYYETAGDSVWVRWSFYDPATDMEGPMGPITKGIILDSVAGPLYRPTLWSLGWLRERSTPTNWIRVYRTHSLADALGEDDSTIWYCAYQFPIQQMSGDQEGTQVIFGMIPDTVLTNGVEFALLDQGYKTYSDSATFLPTPIDSTPFTADNEAYDLNGDFIIRPPVVEQLVIYFSGMKFANYRLWGTGDPLYPARLYYSNYKGYWDWSASRYLDFDEGEHDEIVAIERVENRSGDILYVFTHERIYALQGPDPEFSINDVRLTDNLGLIYRHAFVRVDDEMFFMARDGQVYSLKDGQIAQLSGPISDRMITFFTDIDSTTSFQIPQVPGYVIPNLHPKDGMIHAYRQTNKVCWLNTITGQIIAFDLRTRTWGEESFYLHVPLGSFAFDTVAAPLGTDKYSWWTYGDANTLYREVAQGLDTTWRPKVQGFLQVIPDWAYGTFEIGDDNHIWEIQKVDINGIANSGTILRGYVLNRRGDTLATGNVTFGAGYDRYTMSFPPHSGNHLSILFWSDSTLGTPGDTLGISSFLIHPRRIGRARY